MIQSHLDVYSYIVRELPSFEDMPDQAPITIIHEPLPEPDKKLAERSIILNLSADSAAMSAQEMANPLHTSIKCPRHLQPPADAST